MKHIHLFLAFVFTLISTVAMAEPVGKDAALYTAQAYMTAKGKYINTAQKPFKARRSTAAADEAYYYVFNAGDDNGYVIVSGDDRTEPILGYVEQGSFDADNIPENMKSWLQLYADQIKYIIDNDLQPSSPQLKARNKVRGTKRSVPELLTTRWDQGHPYNLTCPYYYKGDGTLAYSATGCTATAMAQVINFYKYPEKTKALIPAISNTYTLDNGVRKTVSTKTIPRNTIIDWENMRDTYVCDDQHEHNAQDSAVANLMLLCGQAVNMGYGASSGANFDTRTFVTYLGYDDGCYIGERGNYSIDQWFDMLYKEIDEGFPVLFSGFSSGGGHAFVLDGFDGDNLFHVNWGWSGGSNGWFLVGILNPGDNSGIGASSSSDGYSMGQRALFNLRLPDKIAADPTTALTINDVEFSGESIKGSWINWTGTMNSFDAGIVELKDDGTIALVGSAQTLSNLANNTYLAKSFSMKGKLSEGVHKLSPASKLHSAKVWRPKYNLRDEYIEATVANGVTTLRHKEPNYQIEIDTIIFPGTRIVNTEQEVKVIFRNLGDEYYREVMFFASQDENMIYTESRSMVAVRKDETVEVSYYFKPTQTGTYNLYFSTNNNRSGLVGEGQMEIVDQAHASKANLSVSNITIQNAVSGTVYGNCLMGKVTIRNNSKVNFDGQVRIQYWTMKNGENMAYSGASKTVNITVAAGRNAIAEFEFENLNSGYTYFLPIYYVGQEGELSGGGLWEHSYSVNRGVLLWTKAGVVSGKARSVSMSTPSTAVGMYLDCDKINRLTPNKNANTIYAFAEGMEVAPNLLDSVVNLVSGKHADRINLVNDEAFYAPISFNADSASFTYTFPETENGRKWHTFTMPFEADSIFVDSIAVKLDDEENHFWIYEFAAQDDEDNIIFKPATVLRAATPYIIAGDRKMAGKSIVFRSLDVPFFKTGSDKMVVSTDQYKFHGTTLAPNVKDCYVLNESGTAFEYVTASTPLLGLNAYFTTKLSEEKRLEKIVLPAIPADPGLPGDVNGDDAITIKDVVAVLEIMAADGNNPLADINGDGAVTIKDVVAVLEIMAAQ